MARKPKAKAKPKAKPQQKQKQKQSVNVKVNVGSFNKEVESKKGRGSDVQYIPMTTAIYQPQPQLQQSSDLGTIANLIKEIYKPPIREPIREPVKEPFVKTLEEISVFKNPSISSLTNPTYEPSISELGYSSFKPEKSFASVSSLTNPTYEPSISEFGYSSFKPEKSFASVSSLTEPYTQRSYEPSFSRYSESISDIGSVSPSTGTTYSFLPPAKSEVSEMMSHASEPYGFESIFANPESYSKVNPMISKEEIKERANMRFMQQEDVLSKKIMEEAKREREERQQMENEDFFIAEEQQIPLTESPEEIINPEVEPKISGGARSGGGRPKGSKAGTSKYGVTDGDAIEELERKGIEITVENIRKEKIKMIDRIRKAKAKEAKK